MTNTKDFALEVKSFDDKDGGSIVAYASTFDLDPDSYGDIVRPGAFTKSLKRWEEVGKPIPLLYGHRTDDPKYNIGAVVKAEEDERGLRVEAIFDPENETAQEVRELVKQGRLYQLSFAYDVLDSAIVTLPDGRKAHELRELDIFEVSLVQIPANQHAEVVEVKAADEGEQKETLNLTASLFVRLKDDQGNLVAEVPVPKEFPAHISEDEAEEGAANSKQAEPEPEGDSSELSSSGEKGASEKAKALLAQIEKLNQKEK